MDTIKVFEYCEDNNVPIQFEEDVPEPPKVSDTLIRFNGIGQDAHETLYIEKRPKSEFNFCKTARKPYDLAVGLILLVIAKHAPVEFRISSDGDWKDDWAEIRQAYREIFKEEIDNLLDQ